MRNSVVKSVTSVVRDLNKCGLVDEISMRDVGHLCLPEIKKYPPKEIVLLRKKFKLSQAALARIFNISTSTVQKWEQGDKKPTGSSRKLLDLIERKGIDVFV